MDERRAISELKGRVAERKHLKEIDDHVKAGTVSWSSFGDCVELQHMLTMTSPLEGDDILIWRMSSIVTTHM
jgi:hypothetical protein